VTHANVVVDGLLQKPIGRRRVTAYTAPMMNPVDRKHPFDGVHNFRDFGGYAASSGRRMAMGRFFRSANHAMASDQDLARLAGMNIGAVIDLRRPDERARQPSRRWADFSGVIIENHDHDEGEETWDAFMAGWDMTVESYRAYLLRYYARAPHLPRLVDLFTRYFDVLAGSKGAMVVHCAAGKDRTGLIVALTHELAGVHRDDIIADYLLTNESGRFEAHGAAWAKAIEAERGRAPSLETMRSVMGVEPIYLERSLSVIAGRHGGVERYLRDVLDVDTHKRAAIEARLFG
jgi:protein-tyrosine phosphatase